MLNVVNPYTGKFNLKRNKLVIYEKPSSKSQYKKKKEGRINGGEAMGKKGTNLWCSWDVNGNNYYEEQERRALKR